MSNAERLALDMRSMSLDMRLVAETGAVTTRARVRVRNAGASPLARLALQVSSSLRWQSARLVDSGGARDGVRLPCTQFHVTTDTDHTGAATELVLALPHALPPGAEAELDLYYGGTLLASGERLLRLGAPDTRAAAADWDTVSPGFTGLRGFGNVLWFPVAAPAALLADGASFAAAVDGERQRAAGTSVTLQLQVEHRGETPLTAWFLGEAQPLRPLLARRTPSASPEAGAASSSSAGGDAGGNADADSDAETTRIDRAAWDAVVLNGRPVSLFVAPTPDAAAAADGKTAAPAVTVVGASAAVESSYNEAAQRVLPLLARWLPARGAEHGPQSHLTALALPPPGNQAFADGGLLVAPLHTGDPAALAEALAYPLAAAAVPGDAAAWLRAGVPEFLRLLFLESTTGRDRLLAELGNQAPVLQAAEAARGMDPAALRSCVAVACARTKGAYALIMLRNLLGDAVLEQALTAALAPPAESPDGPAALPRDSTRRFEAALTQASGKDLQWFFRDWLEADRGLPDLQIVQVAPRRVERGVATVTTPKAHRPVAGPIGAEPEAEPDDPRRTVPTAASRNTVGLPDGSWLVAVEVQNNGDATAEVPVTVRSSGLQNALPLRIAPHSRATIRVPFEATPEEVWVNDGTTPEQRSLSHHRTISFNP